MQHSSEPAGSDQLIRLASTRISPADAERLQSLVEQVLSAGAEAHATIHVLDHVRPGAHSVAFNSLALLVASAARRMAQDGSAADRAPVVRSLLHLRERLAGASANAGTEPEPPTPPADGAGAELSIEQGIRQVYVDAVGRSPVAEEIEIWRRNLANGLPFHEFMLLMRRSPEAERHARGGSVLEAACDGECIQAVYELVLGRGASAPEIAYWRERLESGELTRAQMLASLFHSAEAFRSAQADAQGHDGLTCLIMGTGKHLSAGDWAAQAKAIGASGSPPPVDNHRFRHRFHVRGEPRVLVSALCSLYRGGDFIEQFMDNITSQSCFDEHAELVIVDADSPEDEYETIKRYLARHPNIQYHRMKYRIGIYDAWNYAARAARGEYLTNTNLDDLRRRDSFEIQAGVLDNLPFVDVVYQDLYYTFDPRLSFEQIAAFGHKTHLPVVTPHNMVVFNSPHNAPMWRKRLHGELGWFDTRYKSAGDYEFWMRCLAAGKTFYKTNDPHVAYYQNPKGLSTRPDTRGVAEAMEITRTYCRKLVPTDAIVPTPEFMRSIGLAPAQAAGCGNDRYGMVQLALRNLARSAKQSYSMDSAA